MLETSVKRQILVRAKSAFLLQEKEQKNKIAFLAEDNQASFVSPQRACVVKISLFIKS